MNCKFEVGQQVVCVVDRWDVLGGFGAWPLPSKGHVYTVKSIHPGGGYRDGVRVECPSGIWLELAGWEGHFCSFEFKPAKPTSIKDLERLLDLTPEDKLDLEHFDHVLSQLEADGVLKRSMLV